MITNPWRVNLKGNQLGKQVIAQKESLEGTVQNLRGNPRLEKNGDLSKTFLTQPSSSRNLQCNWITKEDPYTNIHFSSYYVSPQFIKQS